MANHAHRIRRKRRYYGSIIENRRLDQLDRRQDRRARAYYARQAAGIPRPDEYMPWTIQGGPAPVAEIRAIMDLTRQHSITLDSPFRDMTPEAEAMAAHDSAALGQPAVIARAGRGFGKIAAIEKLKADIKSGIFDWTARKFDAHE